MKARNLVTILLKLMAFYVFMQFLLMLPSSLQGVMAVRHAAAIYSTGGSESVLSSVFWFLFMTSIIYLVFSVGLFLQAQRLSCLFAGNDDEATIPSGVWPEHLQAWAFRCFGIYALVTWGPKLVETLFRTIIYGSWQLDQVPFLQRVYENWSVLISPLAGVVFGLLLIFRANGLVRLIQLSRPLSRQSVELESMKEHLQPGGGEERR